MFCWISFFVNYFNYIKIILFILNCLILKIGLDQIKLVSEFSWADQVGVGEGDGGGRDDDGAAKRRRRTTPLTHNESEGMILHRRHVEAPTFTNNTRFIFNTVNFYRICIKMKYPCKFQTVQGYRTICNLY